MNETIDYNETFRLYMLTAHRNPNLMPEIVAHINLINFSMTEEGVRQHSLATIIAEQRMDLQQHKAKLIIESSNNRDSLYQFESNILDVLSQSEGNILEDENAITILSTSKNMSEEIQAKQISNRGQDADIDAECIHYLPFANYATILFFCLDRMICVQSIYQFTFDWYMDRFVRHIRENRARFDRNRMQFDLWKMAFTSFLCRTVAPSLYRNDRIIFMFAVTIEILRMDVNRLCIQ